MLNDLLDAAALFFIEIIEANLQKGDTLDSYAQNLIEIKNRYPIVFLGLHLSFFFVVIYAIYYNLFNFSICAIVILKLTDICAKITLLRKAKNSENFSASSYLGTPNFQIKPALRYGGAFIYPLVFYYAIS
ncbi:MAG: hypothetical protein LBP89_02390 [Helicobacteraceae bacterium]|jgi:hypothetical protein|nr:hypothetical protein [Helicobacteraceae bacterium]